MLAHINMYVGFEVHVKIKESATVWVAVAFSYYNDIVCGLSLLT